MEIIIPIKNKYVEGFFIIKNIFSKKENPILLKDK